MEQQQHKSKQRQTHQPKMSEVVIPIDSEPESLSLSIMMEKSLERSPEETSLPPVCKVTAKILEKPSRSSPGPSTVSSCLTEVATSVVTSTPSSALPSVTSTPSSTVTVTSVVPIIVAKTATVVTQASSQAVTVTVPSVSSKSSISFPPKRSSEAVMEFSQTTERGVKAQVVIPSTDSLSQEDKLHSSAKVMLSGKKDKKKKGKKKQPQQQQLEKKESSSSSSSKTQDKTTTKSKAVKDQADTSPTSSVKEREKREEKIQEKREEGGGKAVSSSASSPGKSSSSFVTKSKKKKESKSEAQTPTESVKESSRIIKAGMTTSSSLGIISSQINNQATGNQEVSLDSPETGGGNIISKTPLKMASFTKNGQVSSSTSAVDESGRPGGGRQYKQRRQRKTGGMNFMESQRSLDSKTTCGTTGGVAAGVQRRARKTESSASAASKRSSVSQVSLPGDREGGSGGAGRGPGEGHTTTGGATSSMSYYHDDGAIHERCLRCNHVLEEFSEEEIGMCIVILRTYVHRESALAAPILPEMLKLVSRFASYFPYAWQTERCVFCTCLFFFLHQTFSRTKHISRDH